MAFSQHLEDALREYSLLQHPFYQAWNEGGLSRDTLKHYACQYGFHVDAFPQYVSAAHALCPSREGRQFLLENLIEEEQGEENHPELWRRFAEAVGVTRAELATAKPMEAAAALVRTFMAASQRSYHEGLASLYAYEHQVPEIADVKIDGLRRFYGVETPQGLAFFEVHREADRIHRARARRLLDALGPDEQKQALTAGLESARALWNFLSEVQATSPDVCRSGAEADSQLALC